LLRDQPVSKDIPMVLILATPGNPKLFTIDTRMVFMKLPKNQGWDDIYRSTIIPRSRMQEKFLTLVIPAERLVLLDNYADLFKVLRSKANLIFRREAPIIPPVLNL